MHCRADLAKCRQQVACSTRALSPVLSLTPVCACTSAVGLSPQKWSSVQMLGLKNPRGWGCEQANAGVTVGCCFIMIIFIFCLEKVIVFSLDTPRLCAMCKGWETSAFLHDWKKTWSLKAQRSLSNMWTPSPKMQEAESMKSSELRSSHWST